MIDAVIGAFGLVLDPEVVLVIAASALYGVMVGAIPGLTATMSVALLVPITFFMDPVPAIAAIVTTTATAIFAGDIPGALLRMPGTPASAAYVDEAYRLTRQGQAELALGTGLVTAAIGGLIGTLVLMAVAPQLARFAVRFSSDEYFWLACLGLTCAVMISGSSLVKSFTSLFIGLFIACIGIDVAVGYPRYTFGSVELLAGVSFIPAMIGMFALSELLRSAAGGAKTRGPEQGRLGSIFGGVLRVLNRFKINVVRSSILGTGVGSLPGAGADIAAWISFALSRRLSKDPGKFGKGAVEGIVDGGSANNAAVAGAWTPALVFGIPGDSVTAIAIGILYLKGVNPGPLVFVNTPELVYSVFVAFLLANILLVPIGFVAIKLSSRVLRVPQNLLLPVILLFCIVGSYAIESSTFAVGIMLVLGVLAFFMEANDIPVAPAILGIVLGPMVEDNFMLTVMKAMGDPLGFFDRPIAIGLAVITVMIWGYLLIRGARDMRRRA